MSKYLDDNGLLYLWQKIKNVFVAKEAGKVLSDNNYTTEEKTKLANTAPLNSPVFTGSPLAPTQAAGDNTTKLATTAFVKTAIDNAVAGISGFDYQVVQALPATGERGIIYLVEHSHGASDAYDEYIWLAGGEYFEKIGHTDIDLSAYMLKTDMVAITNSEIDTIAAS